MKKIFSLLLMISIITLSGYGIRTYAEDTSEEKDAKILYTKVQDFLTSNENCPPENFDKICSNYMLQNVGFLTVLDKDPF